MAALRLVMSSSGKTQEKGTLIGTESETLLRADGYTNKMLEYVMWEPFVWNT